ncbi:MAG: DUF1049 domain-containing protein [Tissierellia bacterium]|nr:DUF1049 domain-containing protein [Tissierellia bacterium]
MEKSFIFSLIFAALVAIFALANADKVAINLLFTDVFISQAMVIFVSTILGAVIMALLGMFKSFKLKKEIKDLKKQIEPLEIEKDNLTALVDERGAEITNLNEKIKTLQEEKEKLESIAENGLEDGENIRETEDI